MPRMTKRDAERDFNESVMPYIREQYEQDGIPDWPARREAWNDYTDMLCKDRQISNHQYNTWSHARICCRRGE